MKTQILLRVIILCIGVMACGKDDVQSPHSVQIRIVNNTSAIVSDALLGNQSYGIVLPGQSSAYHSFDSLVYAPALRFYDHDSLIQLSIGFCGTPMPSYLQNGRYIYTLTSDTASPVPAFTQGFGFTFEKE